jgi:putative membrane protein
MAQPPLRKLEDILQSRPTRQTFDPPADKPFDQTSGGAPPYPFPPELLREMAGKSEAEISSLLSKFRTGLSEHRTRASEHRTDLSEHRTDLSDYRSELSDLRTDLSKHRTELSEHRTDLSEHRTILSDSRSLLANERTHLGYLRTGVSLMSFGITLNRFAIFLMQSRPADTDPAITGPLLLRVHSTEQIGLGMVILGVLLLVWSLFRYRKVNKHILEERLKPSRFSTVFVTLSVILLGAVATIVLMVT